MTHKTRKWLVFPTPDLLNVPAQGEPVRISGWILQYRYCNFVFFLAFLFLSILLQLSNQCYSSRPGCRVGVGFGVPTVRTWVLRCLLVRQPVPGHTVRLWTRPRASSSTTAPRGATCSVCRPTPASVTTRAVGTAAGVACPAGLDRTVRSTRPRGVRSVLAVTEVRGWTASVSARRSGLRAHRWWQRRRHRDRPQHSRWYCDWSATSRPPSRFCHPTINSSCCPSSCSKYDSPALLSQVNGHYFVYRL